MNPFIAWWADYWSGATSAFLARAGRLRTPALSDSVRRLSLNSRPVRPCCVGVDLAQGEDRTVISHVAEGKVVRHFEVVRG
ncbi:MAG: hypothetical protein LCH90_19745 [Proteobacteria bacterium]|nr:hypothetical protein [Pseudomonadota bacterium]